MYIHKKLKTHELTLLHVLVAREDCVFGHQAQYIYIQYTAHAKQKAHKPKDTRRHNEATISCVEKVLLQSYTEGKRCLMYV